MIKYFCENCNTFPFLADAKYLGWIVKDHFVFVWKDLHKGIHGMYMKPTFWGILTRKIPVTVFLEKCYGNSL